MKITDRIMNIEQQSITTNKRYDKIYVDFDSFEIRRELIIPSRL